MNDDECVGTSHFEPDPAAEFWPYSDTIMHRGCFLKWPRHTAFIARYNAASAPFGNGWIHRMRDDGSIVTERLPLPEGAPDPGVALLLPIQQVQPGISKVQPGIHVATNPYADRWDDVRLVVLVHFPLPLIMIRSRTSRSEALARLVRVVAMERGPAGLEAAAHPLLWRELEYPPEAIARTLAGPEFEHNFLEIGDAESDRATPPCAGAYEITVDGASRYADVRAWLIRPA
jgi:hypothetical protein